MNALRFRSPTLRRGAYEFAVGDVAPRAGAVTVLLGPNGGGKTTALRMAAGLLAPATGAVEFGGRDVFRIPGAERAAHIALVVQRPSVGAPFTVREVVALGRVARESSRGAVDEALRAVGLTELADAPFQRLSGGQQQRVAVARAFAQHSRGGVLLLDEAFAAVDPPEAAALVQAVRGLAGQGATVLAATHDLALASALADDAWCIDAGRTRAFGAAPEILAPGSATALLGVAVSAAPGARGPIAVADYGAILR